jgi:Bacterial virulence factor lipase N-terminal
MYTHARRLAVVLSILAFDPRMIAAPAVHPLFDLASLGSAPFPTDRFTVAEPKHITGLRVDLPMPNCDQQPSDCEDVAVLNTLDGFNVQPRLSIPFSGPIDVHSVTSETVFLLKLVCSHDDEACDEGPRPQKVGINQIIWDTLTNTLHVESDELLDQHTRYALIVTRGVRDTSGPPVAAAPAFQWFRQTVAGVYKDALLDAVHAARKAGVPEDGIAVASVFTTQSVTAVLEKIRDQIKSAPAAVVDVNLGPAGSRTVFSLQDVAGVSWKQQTQTVPLFNEVNLNLGDLRSVPGAVGQIAFGRFIAGDYQLHPGDFIPSTATLTGTPSIFALNQIYFNLVLPSGTPPPNGWPVAIAGHGGGGSKEGFTLSLGSLAASLAQRGIALIAINAVGHGYGALGSLTVTRSTGERVVFPSGGRGFDQNGDGIIEAREGIRASAPRNIVDDRDGLQQTVADLMQLVQQIESGVDVGGDTLPDLDRSRIYYVSQSLGGVYGAVFLAVEPGVTAGVLTVAGGPRTARTLTRGDRATVGSSLSARAPSLINPPGVTHLEGVEVAAPRYNEYFPLRDGEMLQVRLADGTSQTIQSPVSNSIAGAVEIQDYLDRTEWVMQSASPVAYAPYLRRTPLPDVSAKRLIVQFAKGDQSMPNPATSAMVRAGGLEDRTTFYRHDLAFAENPALPKDPHPFMPVPALFGAIARGAQQQIAVFLDSAGELTIHPEPSRFFEVPIAGPLPEGLSFIR